jgi:hypothetical protein
MSDPRLTGHGFAVSLPSGWEGRIGLRGAPVGVAAVASAPQVRQAPAVLDPAVGIARPVVHLANFGLPSERGDFGSGAVGLMGPRHVLLVLFEHGPESVGTALFKAEGMPMPQPHQFHPNTLQRRIPGQLGYQRFFTHAGRAFCLYAVLGSAHDVPAMAAEARSVLAATEVTPR